jgi:hypothetical protein
MSDNIDSIIGEDPGLIIERAFVHLQLTLCLNNPLDLITSQLQKQLESLNPNYQKLHI